MSAFTTAAASIQPRRSPTERCPITPEAVTPASWPLRAEGRSAYGRTERSGDFCGFVIAEVLPLCANLVPERGQRSRTAFEIGDRCVVERTNLVALDIERPDHLSTAEDREDQLRP